MGKKTLLVGLGVLLLAPSAYAVGTTSLSLPHPAATPYVTSTSREEIQLTSTTMEMQGYLSSILEARARGDEDGLPNFVSAYNKLGDVRAAIICRDSVNPDACRTQTNSFNQEALAQVSALVAADSDDRIKRPKVWENSFANYRGVLKKRIDTWTARYNKAVEDSKAERHSSTAEFEGVKVEFVNGEAVIKGFDLPPSAGPVTTTAESRTAGTDGTASSAL